jgi:hypothetical protein
MDIEKVAAQLVPLLRRKKIIEVLHLQNRLTASTLLFPYR